MDAPAVEESRRAIEKEQDLKCNEKRDVGKNVKRWEIIYRKKTCHKRNTIQFLNQIFHSHIPLFFRPVKSTSLMPFTTPFLPRSPWITTHSLFLPLFYTTCFFFFISN